MNIKKISTGDNPPESINVLIEIPEGATVKYELDKESGYIFVDRFAYTSMPYPFNYGFIPNTHAEDGDPVDVLVVSSRPVNSNIIIPSRVIGMLEMEDEEGVDTKIIAVPTKKVDPFYAHIEDITDLDEPTRNKIKHFFDHYKKLEPNKWVKTKDFLGKGEAIKSVEKGIKAHT